MWGFQQWQSGNDGEDGMDLQNDSEEEPIEFGDWVGQEYGRECERKEKKSPNFGFSNRKMIFNNFQSSHKK